MEPKRKILNVPDNMMEAQNFEEWITAEGKAIPVGVMEAKHLQHTIEFLEREIGEIESIRIRTLGVINLPHWADTEKRKEYLAKWLGVLRHERERRSKRAGMYPEGWPTCPGCGDPALDGHITCGRVQCDEGGRR